MAEPLLVPAGSWADLLATVFKSFILRLVVLGINGAQGGTFPRYTLGLDLASFVMILITGGGRLQLIYKNGKWFLVVWKS